jgi:hypothetical protein
MFFDVLRLANVIIGLTVFRYLEGEQRGHSIANGDPRVDEEYSAVHICRRL